MVIEENLLEDFKGQLGRKDILEENKDLYCAVLSVASH